MIKKESDYYTDNKIDETQVIIDKDILNSSETQDSELEKSEIVSSKCSINNSIEMNKSLLEIPTTYSSNINSSTKTYKPRPYSQPQQQPHIYKKRPTPFISFKIKQSIDEKHTEYLNHFQNTKMHIIPDFIIERKTLQKNYDIESSFEKKLDMKDKIDSLTKEIKALKKQKNEYFLNNSQHIFQYFEDKKNISVGKNLFQNVNKLNNFFKVQSQSLEKTEDDIELSRSREDPRAGYFKYWKNVNNEILNIQDFIIISDICKLCNNGELIPHDEEGILICNNNKCAKFITYIIDSSKPTNKEPPSEVSYTAYIRLNHFKEILSQFQAKETTQIPESVIQRIKDRLNKERITDLSKLNYEKMREILRKLNLNKYFEHIQYINSRLGIKPPIMNEELYETLCVLFIEIQKPWSIHCPPNRTNFFNYTYTLYQLCVLLDQTQYLPYIQLLKDRTKQLEQDMIWKKVCNHLDWAFYPTI